MKTKIIVGLASLLVLAAGQAEGASLGTAFTYQGKLSHGSDGVTGVYDFQFSLFDTASGGSAVAGPLLASAVGVTNGLFTTTLDFSRSPWTGEAHWLDILVRTNGGSGWNQLLPRQALTPAPYALYAPNAGAAVSASTATTASTATLANGVAPNAVDAQSIQSGQVVKSLNGLRDQVLLSPGINVSLATNGSTLTLSAGPWSPANASNTWFSGGRVGIGKAPAVGALDVFDGSGVTRAGGSIHVGGMTANGDPKLIHFGDMQTNGMGYVYLGENGQDDTLELRAGRFYFNSGNVGIFKTNPATALDVAGTISAANFVGDGSGLTSLSPLSLSLQGDARLNMHDLYFREGDDRFHGVGWYGAGKTFSGINVDGPVLYGFSGGGLGTTADNTNLALRWLQGGIVAIDPQNLNSGALAPGLIFGDNSGEGIASKRTAGGNAYGLDFYTGFNNRMAIANNGNVGIGVTSPSTKLEVNGTVKAASFQGQGAVGWQLVTSTSQDGAPNSGYVVNNASLVTVTLPSAPAIGDVLRVTGAGSGGWKISQSGGQWIWSGSAAIAPAGASWTQVGSSLSWWSVASSTDGTKLVACAYGNFLYTSLDGGTNWLLHYPGATPNVHNWYGVASSADGAKLAAIVRDGSVYVSGDSGATWTTRGSAGNHGWCIASSADGTRLVAGNGGAPGNGYLYISNLDRPSGANTTPGASGSLIGGQGSAIELQYVGASQFMVLSSNGRIYAY